MGKRKKKKKGIAARAFARKRGGKKQHTQKGVMQSCGECTACCTVLGVDEISKPDYTRCNHEGDGCCSIYNVRPKTCAAFQCAYTLGILAVTDEDEGAEIDPTVTRPDKLGLILYPTHNAVFGSVMMVYEAWSDAFKAEISGALIESLRAISILILVGFDGADRKVIGPNSAREKIEAAAAAVKQRMEARATGGDR